MPNALYFRKSSQSACAQRIPLIFRGKTSAAFPDGSSTTCVAQLVGHLTRKSGVLVSIPGLATYFRFSFRFFKKGSCQLLAKVCARSTVNRLGGLSLPRKSVVRLTDRPNMTLDVYRGR